MICPPNHKHSATVTCRRVHGCKCDPCMKANALNCAYRRRIAGTPELIDAAPTIRRLRAMTAIGWGIKRMADALDTHYAYVGAVRAGKYKTVLSTTAEKVAEFYERECMTPIPSGVRASSYARRQGWVPPLAYDDIERETRPKGMVA